MAQKRKKCFNILNRLGMTHECGGQTDGWMDRWTDIIAAKWGRQRTKHFDIKNAFYGIVLNMSLQLKTVRFWPTMYCRSTVNRLTWMLSLRLLLDGSRWLLAHSLNSFNVILFITAIYARHRSCVYSNCYVFSWL